MNRFASSRMGVTFLFFFLFSSMAKAQWNVSGSNVWLNGAVGIGTSTPAVPLDLQATWFGPMASFKTTNTNNSWVTVGNGTGWMNLGVGQSTPYPYVWTTSAFFIGSDGAPTIFVDGMSNGNVGVNTTDTKGYKLAVNGDAVFNRVVVKAYPWADYVFAKEYRLRPLKEVASYIRANHHLPDMPAAAEVEKDGVDVGQNQTALLKKVEELTLYVIQLEKDVTMQKKELSKLRSLVKAKK